MDRTSMSAEKLTFECEWDDTYDSRQQDRVLGIKRWTEMNHLYKSSENISAMEDTLLRM